MSFEYIGSAAAAAKQLMPWGGGLLAVGIGFLIYSQIKDKALAYTLVSFALMACGGYMLYQSKILSAVDGEWRINADSQTINWQSPDESVDPSFNISLSDIDYIDRAGDAHTSANRADYRIIGKDGSVRLLSYISGIDMFAFISFLESNGLEVKETGKYRKSVESKNR